MPRRSLRAILHAAARFLPGRPGAAAGRVFRNPLLAGTLEGHRARRATRLLPRPYAEAIAEDMQRRKGLLSARLTLPPPVRLDRPDLDDVPRLRRLRTAAEPQGIAALEMLNILEGFDLKALGHNSAVYLICWSRPSGSLLPTATRGWPMAGSTA